MLNFVIWGGGILLEVLLLIRGCQGRLYRQFPIFYGYLLLVTLIDLLRIGAYRWASSHYFQVYWGTQFLSLAIGSGVIFEIYRVALRPFRGAARMARCALLIVFGAIFAKVLTVPPGEVFDWLAAACIVLERNLRMVQALAILTLVLVFLWYAIPFGKNLKGILIGYSLFIGLSILQFGLWRYSWERIKPIWSYAQPVCYLLVLGIWARALWSAEPVPLVAAQVQIESDYELLITRTRGQFRKTIARLGWVARA
ncbi:MAG TPA: hypothetical protein VFI38_05465 [Candidatus Acidoferrum sp.]|nr:hypothetical protein [Candidatus Acidoferrum sp.]